MFNFQRDLIALKGIRFFIYSDQTSYFSFVSNCNLLILNKNIIIFKVHEYRILKK